MIIVEQVAEKLHWVLVSANICDEQIFRMLYILRKIPWSDETTILRAGLQELHYYGNCKLILY